MSQNPDSPVAKALRAEGYVPLPRLWVKSEDMPAVQKIAFKHANAVNTIRHAAKNQGSPSPAPRKNPIEDKDAAWEAYEQRRNQG